MVLDRAARRRWSPGVPAVERGPSSHSQPTQRNKESADVHRCLVQWSVGVVVTVNWIAGKKPATTKSLMLNLEQYQTKEISIAHGTRTACSEEFRGGWQQGKLTPSRIQEKGGKR